MRLFLLTLIISICIPIIGHSQSKSSPAKSTSKYIHCSKFYISKPIREFPDYKPGKGAKREEPADEKRRMMHPANGNFHPSNDYTDPIRQYTPGSRIGLIAPIINIDGTPDSLWAVGDPNGAVGPNNYVQVFNNLIYTVYDKNGNKILAPKDLGYLWAGHPRDGDPVALYDKFADRWFISEFQVTNIPYQLCVGVSTTNDPTGSYYVWEFSMDTIFPDYPKYSIWTDGYYVTFQGFGPVSLIEPQEVAVLERSRMLNGDPGAGMIVANLPSPPDKLGGHNSLVSAPKTFDCDASSLPPYGTPNYLVYYENVASGGYSNSIVMYQLATDTAAHTLTVTRADSFPVPTFNGYFTGGHDADISQPGYPHGVDALDGTFNFRVPYMKFTGYNSVVLSNTVNLGDTVAGIRWYELRQNDTTQRWSIYQEGTYGPNDGISRWNGSICMDDNGDIALAYTVASSSVYPGIRYTGRLSTDSLGQMTFAEQTAIAGTTTLFETIGRWGDYSELDLDPSDGLTFWDVNQYGDSSETVGTSSSDAIQRYRIFSFKLASALGTNDIQNKPVMKVYQNGDYLNIKVTDLPSNDRLTVNLFDITGRQLTSQSVAPESNMFETAINVSTLPKGIYLVRIGRVNFQKVVKTFIN